MVFVKRWRFFNLQLFCKMNEKKFFSKVPKEKKAFLEQKHIGPKNHLKLEFVQRG